MLDCDVQNLPGQRSHVDELSRNLFFITQKNCHTPIDVGAYIVCKLQCAASWTQFVALFAGLEYLYLLSCRWKEPFEIYHQKLEEETNFPSCFIFRFECCSWEPVIFVDMSVNYSYILFLLTIFICTIISLTVAFPLDELEVIQAPEEW